MRHYLRQGLVALAAALALAGALHVVSKTVHLAPPVPVPADSQFQDVVSTDNTLRFAHLLLTWGQNGRDSWAWMDLAARYWQDHPRSGRLYTDVLITGHHRFQYPPVSLLLPLFVNRHLGSNADRFYFTLGMLSLLVMGLASYRIAVWSLRSVRITPSPLEHAQLLALSAVATLVFLPATLGVVLGNIQPWINAVFALALLCMVTGRDLRAGLLIGLVTCIKPQLAVLVLWSLWRGHRAFTAGMLAVAGAGLAIGIAVFGLGNHLDYLRGLSFLSHHGEAYYANQSLNGLLQRLAGVSHPLDYGNLRWISTRFPPFNPWVFYPTMVSGVAILATCLLIRPAGGAIGRGLDFCLMSLGATLASPISWTHHYGILLPMFALLWPLLSCGAGFKDSRGARLTALLAFAVAANFIPFTNLLAGTYWNFLQSYVFFAALALFAVLLLAENRLRQDAPHPRPMEIEP